MIIAHEYISIGNIPVLSSTFIPGFLRTSISLSTSTNSIDGIGIPLLLIYFFSLGVFFSIVRRVTDSVWYPIVMHVIFNGLICVITL
ncbi:type II CAAX prenyl endopeptidase Rce1 family protein [Chloroflexota bacterium]